MKVTCLTFNEFAENTYILHDDTGECVIVDPGCNSPAEEVELDSAIDKLSLKPVRLINTHCHIDHVFGINYVRQKYELQLEIHEGEQALLGYAQQIGQMYGMPVEPIAPAEKFLTEDDIVEFGETHLEILFTPGHSPASICFLDRAGKQVIAGDVLFQGSIGRTDLPGGDYDTLIGSIVDKLLVLDDDVIVFPGHGPSTTIGFERAMNPFLQGMK